MPDVKASADFQDLIKELERVAKEWAKVAQSEALVAKQATGIIAAFNEQQKALSKLITEQTKLTKSFDEHIKKQKAVQTVSRQTTAELEKQRQAALAATRAMAKEAELTQRNLQRGYTAADIKRLGAAPAEVFDYKNQLGKLKELQKQHQVTNNTIRRMWAEIARGETKAYAGDLRTIRNQLVKVKSAQDALGVSQRKTFDKQAQQAVQNQLAGLKQTTRAVTELDEKTKQLTISWGSFARLLAVQLFHQAVSAAVRAIGEGVTRTIELEKRIGEVQTISGKLPLQTEEWYSNLKQLSDFWGIDLINEIEATYQALSNQVVKGAATFEFLAEANQFATVAVTDASTAVNLLTAAINAYGKVANDAHDISAQLFKTIELGRVRADEMADSYGRIAVPAAKLGVTMAELNATITSTTIQGFKYSEAATAIRNVFLKMIKPTEEMTKWFNQLGVSSGEALIATYGFTDGLRLLMERSQGSTTELGKLFGRLRAMIGAFLLSGRGLEVYNRNLAEIQESYKTYDEKLEDIFSKAGKQLDIQLNRIKNFFTTAARDLTIFVAGWTDNFRKFTVAIKASADTMRDLAIFSIPFLIDGLAKLAIWLGPQSLIIIGLTAAIALTHQFFRSLEDNAKKIDEIVQKNQSNWTRQRAQFIDKMFQREIDAQNASTRNQLNEIAKVTRYANAAVEEHSKVYEGFRRNIGRFEIAITKAVKDRIKILKKEISDLQDVVDSVTEDQADVANLVNLINERRLTGLDRPGRAEPITRRKYELAYSQLVQAEDRLRQASLRLSKKDFDVWKQEVFKAMQEVVKFSDELFEEGLTGPIRSAESFYKYYDQIIQDLQRNMATEASRQEKIKENQLEDEEKILEILKDQVNLVKQTTLQELLKAETEEDINKLFKDQATALGELKKYAKEYKVDFTKEALLDEQLIHLRLLAENKITLLREAEHQKELTRIRNEGDARLNNLKDLIKEWNKWVTNRPFMSEWVTQTRRKAVGGPAGIDTRTVNVSPNEFIMNERASRQFYSTLTAMNSGVQRFAYGGAPTTYNIGDINLHPQSASDINVLSLGKNLRREIRRGRLRLN